MKTVSWDLVKTYFSKIKRNPNSHKGENGKVLVIGGSNDLVGAPALAAMSALACLRTGVDLVFVATLEKPGWAMSTYSPDLIVKKLKGGKWSPNHLKPLLEMAKNSDVVLIGNGMGREKKTLSLIRKFVRQCRTKIVLDADAIYACSRMRFERPCLITPHSKEFLEFCGKSVEGTPPGTRISIAQKAAKKHNCTILLKGKSAGITDIVTDGQNAYANKTGHRSMTRGGTGDILAGLCAGFIALGSSEIQAACAAAYINGKIGRELYKKLGYSLIASDFIAQIPEMIKKLLT